MANNLFEGNIGLKKHNGGAYLHRCIKSADLSDNIFSAKNQTSSLELGQRIEDKGDFLYYYDDPVTKEVNITDLFNATHNYTLLKYATKVANNNFTSNFAGMKGSALAMFELSELQITQNFFKSNGPVTSFEEEIYSPYFKYFALGAKKLTMNLPITDSCVNATNEFEYVEQCVNQLKFIDTPPLTGAIHIENCEAGMSCYGPQFNVNEASIDEQFEKEHSLIFAHQRAYIADNVFINN